ncbi:endonuclease/exonuclease/phosphatase family protein (plasmid) [Streptomyces sp. BI20]|uniref:endonuclease/exonuclease/phosphatase family protein n=1 Tax=Streptomyces sp. BI20 TaxID=3403460 RepID=UPI003C791E61
MPRRGRVLTAIAAVCAAVLLWHGRMPNGPGRLLGLVESFLPWAWLPIALLALLALLRRSPLALIAVLLPATVWACLFGGQLHDKRGTGGGLRVVSHNVDDDNPDPDGTARALVASGADVIGLEKLVPAHIPAYERGMNAAYPYHRVEGTVGIWSRMPLTEVRPVAIMAWTRALRATVRTPEGPVAVFVAHLPSVRVRAAEGFTTRDRDAAIGRLARAVDGAPEARRIVMGDFNGTTDDRGLAPIASRMRSAQLVAGAGFGFSWPAAAPVVRIDQIFVQGAEPVSAWTLPRTGSDHLPVAASIRL